MSLHFLEVYFKQSMKTIRCISKNLSILIGIAVIAITIVMLCDPLKKVVSHPIYQTVALIGMIASIITIYTSKNPRLTLLVVYLSTLGVLLSIASSYAAPVVVRGGVFSLFVFIVLSFTGMSIKRELRN